MTSPEINGKTRAIGITGTGPTGSLQVGKFPENRGTLISKPVGIEPWLPGNDPKIFCAIHEV
jgi:hypothetical protein